MPGSILESYETKYSELTGLGLLGNTPIVIDIRQLVASFFLFLHSNQSHYTLCVILVIAIELLGTFLLWLGKIFSYICRCCFVENFTNLVLRAGGSIGRRGSHHSDGQPNSTAFGSKCKES